MNTTNSRYIYCFLQELEALIIIFHNYKIIIYIINDELIKKSKI